MGSDNADLDSADAALVASLRRLVANMGELVGVSSVALVLLDPASGDVRARVAWSSSAIRAGSESRDLSPQETIEGQVARRLEPMIVADARAHRPVSLAPDPRPGALICLPLVEADRLLGTLTATTAKPRAFDAHRLQLVQVFADQAALAIAKTLQAAAAEALAREQLATSLSMVVHELRTPLQSVNGYLDLILSGQAGPLSPQQRQYVARSRAGGQRLAAIVDDLLLLSRRDAGKFTLRLEPVDLVPLVREVADEMEGLADEAGVRLELALPEQLPPALADAARIAQVLRNLLANALKFTPRGGTITVDAAAAPDHVAVSVRDTGIGIAPEYQARIFERFYQVPTGEDGGEDEQRPRTAGQGLGLAIVRIIVEGHGGSVNVASASGQGSVFTFTLPLA